MTGLARTDPMHTPDPMQGSQFADAAEAHPMEAPHPMDTPGIDTNAMRPADAMDTTRIQRRVTIDMTVGADALARAMEHIHALLDLIAKAPDNLRSEIVVVVRQAVAQLPDDVLPAVYAALREDD